MKALSLVIRSLNRLKSVLKSVRGELVEPPASSTISGRTAHYILVGSIVILFAMVLCGRAIAADCRLASSTCVDNTASKTISGVTVTLAEAGGCWEYQDTYTCIKPNAVDNCSAFGQISGCWQVSSTCAVTDTTFGTGCMQWDNTWRCGNPALSTPSNTIRVADSYTIVTDTLNNTQCQSYANSPTCAIASHICIEPAATRIINGLPVYKDCWSWQDNYSCLGTPQTDCGALLARGCALSTSQCLTTAINNQCSLTEKTYRCQSAPGSSSTVADCGGNTYCTGGNCFNTGHVPDTDFAQTAAMMEVMRQGGNYMDAVSLRIFGGQGSSCKKSLFGLVNCCKPSGGGAAVSNASVMGYAVSAGGQTLKYGSSYMYDTLFDNFHIVRGLDSVLASTPIGSLAGGSSMPFSPSFSLYGFTATWGAMPGALGSFGGISFAFDPTSLAIQVGLMILQELLSCDQPEKMLAMKKGQNLCRYTGSHCSIKIPIIGSCMQTTESYCCFNSRLARIINTSGGVQIGKPVTDCTGFTPTEFSSLDFSRIDLTEFFNEIMANVRMPSATIINTDSTATMQRKLNNYYTRGRQ
ncbi:IncF plasmid conjugative transfer protein TraN [Candidatus Nitrotoga sp. 1052]|nr:IncF plasmid conjugative transfer protein TraN [Candidatus Nitrotoga sp. 1052]